MVSWDPVGAKRTSSLVRLAAVAVLVGVGLFAITGELDWPLSVVPAAVLVVVLALRWVVDRAEDHEPTWLGAIVVVVSAMVVALFALVGVDVALGQVVHGRLSPVPGALVGAVVIGGASWLFVDAWPDPWVSVRGAVAAGIAVALLIILPPAAVLVAGAIQGDGSYVLPEGNTGSSLEVVVLRDGGGPAPPHAATSGGWAVTTWVGDLAADRTVRWGRGATAAACRGRRRPRAPLEPHGAPHAGWQPPTASRQFRRRFTRCSTVMFRAPGVEVGAAARLPRRPARGAGATSTSRAASDGGPTRRGVADSG